MTTTLANVNIVTADGEADAYLVTPGEQGAHPGVLMFMDAFGLRPRLADMAARIAERGYAVLVPNLFYRSGRPPLIDPAELAHSDRRGAAFERLRPMMSALTPAAIIADTGSYLDFFAAQPAVAPGPVALVGYCMGGRNGLRAISAYPGRIAALAGYHAGGTVTDAPDSPHLAVGSITGEVYFGHADNDRSMSPEQIKALEAALDEAGVTYTSEVYEGAPHGFTMSDTASHHEEGERRHWESLFALLDRVLPVS